MPGPYFFRSLGLYVDEDFLDPAQCARLRQEMLTAQLQPATIWRGGRKPEVDESFRKVASARLAGPLEEELQKRLLDLMPALGAHFHMALTGCQPLEYLRYGVGSFFKLHADFGSYDLMSFARRVSVVIFLNRRSKELAEGAYGGGSLLFYDLMDGKEWQNVGLPLAAQPGLLVAFPSTLRHEVQPVTHGERLTVVSWFTSDEYLGNPWRAGVRNV